MDTVNRVKINYSTCAIVHGPLLILTFVANLFFIFCMVCPFHGEKIKQPLKLILGSLICGTMSYLIASFVLFSWLEAETNKTVEISLVVLTSSLSVSMTSSVWLNIFYYTLIVPAQRTLFIWIKKNIKPIIYCFWLFDRIYSLFEFTIWTLNSNHFHDNYNLTMDCDTCEDGKCLEDLNTLLFDIVGFRFSFYFCAMLMSSGSTLVYLCRHMRRMTANGQPFSCQRFRSQVRVTATGILQVILSVFCALWYVYKSSSVSIPLCSNFTVYSLYIAGTTFNLGAGQGVFRKRAADIWLKATQWCKAPKTQSEQGG